MTPRPADDKKVSGGETKTILALEKNNALLEEKVNKLQEDLETSKANLEKRPPTQVEQCESLLSSVKGFVDEIQKVSAADEDSTPVVVLKSFLQEIVRVMPTHIVEAAGHSQKEGLDSEKADKLEAFENAIICTIASESDHPKGPMKTNLWRAFSMKYMIGDRNDQEKAKGYFKDLMKKASSLDGPGD